MEPLLLPMDKARPLPAPVFILALQASSQLDPGPGGEEGEFDIEESSRQMEIIRLSSASCVPLLILRRP